MWTRRYPKTLLASTATFLLLGIGSTGAVASNLSRSYQANSVIPNGSLVSLDPTRSNYIQAADLSNSSRLVGIAVASQDSLLAIDPSNTTVQVAINGSATTLVSTVNGDIHVGDPVGASPFGGIGMEALSNTRIIGVAQTAFTAQTSGAATEQVRDRTGKTHNLQVGYIRVNISVGTGSNNSAGSRANFLQRVIRNWTGRTISTVRIILSMVVALVALISLITVVYASIYGSIISVGRNPLAKTAIFRTLSSVLIMTLITVGIACVTIYYLLR